VKRSHAMPFGAECRDDGSVRFRLWAPKARSVELLLCDPESHRLSLSRQSEGWFELVTDQAKAGSLYQYQISGQLKVPDPASRFQPSDVHGPSEVVDPAAFEWEDQAWLGRAWQETVIYELHVGTFTPEGTFAGVQQRLDYLTDLGITALELMPVSDFPGTRNWGYDGVLLYAPDSSYGRPEDLKRLVQAAHAKGLMIFLDVVYNHFGPEGNYLRAYSPEFFTDRHSTPWGDAINFDGEGSRVVRDFFIHNALYWLEEYHFDGLRLDAVHAIFDDSMPDILTELAATVRNTFGPNRIVHLVLENDDNDAHYLERDEKVRPRWYNAQWNDDIHHALHVLLTGETDGYYSDYAQQPIRQLGRCLAEGFAYQGEFSAYRSAVRGLPSYTLPPTAFVSFLQNHDQIGNRAFGERIVQLANEEAVRAAMAVLLLAPSPPLLFMGEEFGARTPFLFFCDFGGELRSAVTEGRRAEFARFARFSSAEEQKHIPDPNSPESFARSKLDWSSLPGTLSQSWLQFYRDLLAIRKSAIVPCLSGNKSCASFTVQEDGGLRVEWRFGNAITLTLVANVSTTSTTLTTRPAGRIVYANRAGLAEDLERHQAQTEVQVLPWSAAWFLHP
jgi:maltooligosyltrehalose trehalohydrolase